VKKDGRYDVSDLPEAQFEPGSKEQVLRNLLGIKSPKAMDDTETRALEKAMVGLVGKYDENHRFTAADIREIHRLWLSEIYGCAGGNACGAGAYSSIPRWERPGGAYPFDTHGVASGVAAARFQFNC
jgi:hypothetical protein